ncbi:Asd/ArgC dimerization domain-containing protein [Acidipila sp. EB88]|uniref:Asd/ArgC dimerization domain-containing protein n=1 Tax=Acidipila sp. EB88 TaxID=2305226 RepID=UPI001F43101B|nr:Asd/ArgC dimerization domain-containing protein [Acidipila sp. EB88]
MKQKIAIVGAASLIGKELAEALEDSAFAAAEIVLMDENESQGQIETIGDEVTVIQGVDQDSFRHVDYVFFSGPQAQASTHWQAAVAAHASIIDLSGVLESEPGVLVASPWVRDSIEHPTTPLPDLHTPALVPAHIAATALGMILARLQDVGAVQSAWATVHEPASEHGRAAVDELHQQTVTLLNFQNMPKDVFDMQVAFNLTPVLGEAAKIDLVATEARIRRHYALLSGGRLPRVSIQLLQVPAFHGYGISLGVELDKPVALEHLEATLAGEHADVIIGDGDPPSNLSSAGQEDMLLRIRQADANEGLSTRFWIWAAFDNLKLASLNAIACAGELKKLRPQGKVQ